MFLAKNQGHILAQEGHADERHSPCSTFKIALSLMAYNEGFLIDETTPAHPCTPHEWIQNSYVWYSQCLTKKLGQQKLSEYLQKFNYGNQDISGDPGQNNGLTQAWLSSSLQISIEEQVSFLEKLLANNLPISQHANDMTQKLLFNEILPNGWTLYGKTGTGHHKMLQQGWFMGWVQKENQKITFAQHIQNKDFEENSAGKRAREIAKEKLIDLLRDKS
jgi:beta-lactamase class D